MWYQIRVSALRSRNKYLIFISQFYTKVRLHIVDNYPVIFSSISFLILTFPHKHSDFISFQQAITKKLHMNDCPDYLIEFSFRTQQLVNLYEHYLDTNVVLLVYNIVIKLLLVVHQIIQFVYGILNAVHVYVSLKDMMNLYVAFVLILNELFQERMMVRLKQTEMI